MGRRQGGGGVGSRRSSGAGVVDFEGMVEARKSSGSGAEEGVIWDRGETGDLSDFSSRMVSHSGANCWRSSRCSWRRLDCSLARRKIEAAGSGAMFVLRVCRGRGGRGALSMSRKSCVEWPVPVVAMLGRRSPRG